ncbi:hypothetical protein D3C80_360090 [compost metagenome]
MRLRAKTEIQSDVEDGGVTGAQLVNRPGQSAFANILTQRNPGRFFEQLLHVPQGVAGILGQLFKMDHSSKVSFDPFTEGAD